MEDIDILILPVPFVCRNAGTFSPRSGWPHAKLVNVNSLPVIIQTEN